MKKLFLILFLLVSCGKSSQLKSSPKDLDDALRTEIERIEPQLLWACGLPTEANRPDCSGDALSMAGTWLQGKYTPEVWQSVVASIDSDGRPWRNSDRPDYDGNSFSRDQLLGLVESTMASKDLEPLARVRAYYRAKKDRLCPGDDRCNVTPSMDLLVRETLGQSADVFERAQDEVTVNAEAATNPPTYRSYLAMRKLFLRAEMGQRTPLYRKAAQTLVTRFSRHLFARYVDYRMNGGDEAVLQSELLACMTRWQKPGTSWWGDELAFSSGCHADVSQGHELVSLAYLFLK